MPILPEYALSEPLPCGHKSRYRIESNGGVIIAIQCGVCHFVNAIHACSACGNLTIKPRDEHCRVPCIVGVCRNLTLTPRIACRVHAPGPGKCVRCKDSFERRSNNHAYCSVTCKTLASRKKEAPRGNV